jgi:hypothetical protein
MIKTRIVLLPVYERLGAKGFLKLILKNTHNLFKFFNRLRVDLSA